MALFASPLINIPIKETEYVTRFFKQKLLDKSSSDNLSSDSALMHYHSGNNVFNIYPELTPLKNYIEQAGSFAYKELLNYQNSGNLKVTSAWFNLCEVGGSQSVHSHANSIISGTLYLHADDNSEIEFFHPQTNNSFHAELHDEAGQGTNKHQLRFHRKVESISVNTGDCLFWPSQLRHGYKNNKTPGRLTLSFNMLPEHLNAIYQLA